MGYRILNIPADIREKYVPRTGLEGPFFYDSGTVLYYCPKHGAYYDPGSDMFLTYDEYVQLTDRR